jgi:hypothetical protein
MAALHLGPLKLGTVGRPGLTYAKTDSARRGRAIRLRTWAGKAILSWAKRGFEALVGRVAASEVA